MSDQKIDGATRPPATGDADTDSGAGWSEAGDEDVPTVVLYVIAGLLLLSFTLYLVVGGGHGFFH